MEGDRNYWDTWMRRRMSRRRVLQRAGLAGLALAGASSLWACGQTETPKASEPATSKDRPKRGGTLRIVTEQQPTEFDIHTTFAGGNDMYYRAVFESPVDFDNRLEYKPELSLAEKWEVLDDVTLLFKFRKGVKFQDGTDFNAQAFKFNLERTADPKTKSPRAYIPQAMKNVEYPDDYSVKITLNQPMGSILGELAVSGMGQSSPTNIQKLAKEQLDINPIGTGPFKSTEVRRDDRYVYAQYKDYWRKDGNGDQLPYLDGVRLQIVPDATVRVAQLKTAEADVNMDTPLKDVTSLKDDPEFKIQTKEPFISGMYMNMSRPPFTSLNFRRALTYGVNRDAIVKVVTFGVGRPFVSFVLPLHGWAFDPNLPIPKYDPVKAKQYADAAAAEGIKMEFTTYATTARDDHRTTEMMQADYAKLGIKMNVLPESGTTSAPFRFFNKPHEIDTFYTGYSARPDPYSGIFTAHHSKGTYTPEDSSVGPGWDTPEKYYARVDKLIDDSNRTYDLKKRAQLLNEAAKIFADEVQFLGIYYRPQVTTLRKNVQGEIFAGDGKARFDTIWLKS